MMGAIRGKYVLYERLSGTGVQFPLPPPNFEFMTYEQRQLLKDLSIADLGYLLAEFQRTLKHNSQYIEMHKLGEDGNPELTSDQQIAVEIINYSSKGAEIVQIELFSRMRAIFGPVPSVKDLQHGITDRLEGA